MADRSLLALAVGFAVVHFHARVIRLIFVTLAASILAGCANITTYNRTCAVRILTEGRTPPTAQQVVALEDRVEPLLAKRGLLLTREKNNAAQLAWVGFRGDVRYPGLGDFYFINVGPNPLSMAGTPRTEIDENLQRELHHLDSLEQSLMENNSP